MQNPAFRYLCTYRADLNEPQQMIGKAHFGRRMIAVLTGGVVEGERLRGRIVPGGGDWATIDENDTLRLDARVTMETHDGALIFVSYRGVLRPMSKVREYSVRGGPANDAERAQVYFRTTPIFETGDERYAWLNNIVAVGLGDSIGGAVRYNVFEVL
ncbi:hypothetical protein HPO_17958 [Hyphomonas polymorpha PS728]|uniref:UPF0311 protein HPO_17958 n=1 Tax=Hyphomonas polymorpha PS728 TaxID=1280954 RepID=A0A062V9N6_9PROT|nr:DUF3237 domain-containing protein [Hyphomonas polymorpha]KCZ96836.1 hypothetical protein HPO_17958 [Hyphomonas polymorpha PS728]